MILEGDVLLKKNIPEGDIILLRRMSPSGRKYPSRITVTAATFVPAREDDGVVNGAD